MILYKKPEGLKRSSLIRLLLIMKLIILLIILNITTVFANSNAQSITIEAKNITLVNTMHAIQKQSGYAFFLKGKQLANIRQDISISKLSLSKAMAEILKDVSAEWELENGTIVIRAIDQKKKETLMFFLIS